MKAHVGVDSQTKLIHSVVATAANLADARALPHLLHGEETRVWGDQAYRGQRQVLRQHAPHAQDFTHQRYRYKDRIDEVEREKNRTKSKVRSKVEHVFAVLKLRAAGIGVEHGVPLFRSEDSSAAVSKRAALFTNRSGARSVRWRRPRRCVPLNRFLVPLILNTLFRFVKSIMPCSAL